MKTGFVYDPRFLEHQTEAGHPERAERLVATMDFLKRQPWFSALERVVPQPADRAWVEQVHSAEYIARASEACRRGFSHLDVLDVSISERSWDVALLAAGAALALGDRVIAGQIRNGFALVRPPGHHAERATALGFCLFNNVAIVTRYLQKAHGLDKILILDWDVHHGNGTQHTFEEDPSVLYVSLHQYPFYPGTGAASETGIGRGAGATLNCPMAAGAGDEEYEAAFAQRVLPRIEEYQPEAVVVSAGFDAHRADPLANISLSTEFFRWMSERMLEVAETHAQGRLISLLEGGYNTAVLPQCIAEHLLVLSGQGAKAAPS
ncbi:MAG: histone deacetylase [Gammaproteobacteria bacterium]|nr:histone deacetylase [Gammaproteobacteria bacterium]NIR83063.1 histone deacetylase [Gammaproteobacteria bacterium]NIR90725.1 histone deacetylase [Gammaproteobacteria bacterium]NIU04216.1 histone deacetylase [Gammaproteobacteria bacterium]NIV51508.1 histone deacetylase [Gammaproteobacteria bacterium]